MTRKTRDLILAVELLASAAIFSTCMILSFMILFGIVG